jgi:hypothetical protein
MKFVPSAPDFVGKLHETIPEYAGIANITDYMLNARKWIYFIFRYRNRYDYRNLKGPNGFSFKALWNGVFLYKDFLGDLLAGLKR